MDTTPIAALIEHRRALFAEINRLRSAGVQLSQLRQMYSDLVFLDKEIGRWAWSQPATRVIVEAAEWPTLPPVP